MVDTLDLVRGMHTVVAGEGEHRVSIDDGLTDGINVTLISAKKVPSELCRGPRYNVLRVGTETIPMVKPFEKRFRNQGTGLEKNPDYRLAKRRRCTHCSRKDQKSKLLDHEASNNLGQRRHSFVVAIGRDDTIAIESSNN